MRIQHNILAMNSYRNYSNNTSALGKNLEKLSSGYKINRAGDDAAGLAISEKMRAQIQGLNAAQKNVKDAISFVKTAEGAMQEIQDMLSRMKYLATQSANGTYDNEVDRKALQDEVDSLRAEINRIAQSANFNGIYMLNGKADDDTTTDELNTAVPTAVASGSAIASDAITFAFASEVASDVKDAINKAIDGAAFTVHATVSGAAIASGDKITVDFSELLEALGSDYSITYQDAKGSTVTITGSKAIAIASNSASTAGAIASDVTSIDFTIRDKEGNAVGTITLDPTKVNTATTGKTSTVTLSAGEAEDDEEDTTIAKSYTVTIESAATLASEDTITIGSLVYTISTSASTDLASLASLVIGTEASTFAAQLKAALDHYNDNNDEWDAAYDEETGTITFTLKDGVEEATTKPVFEIAETAGGIKVGEMTAVPDEDGDGNGGSGSIYSIDMQIGDSSASFDTMTLEIESMRTSNLIDEKSGKSIDDISIDSLDSAHAAIDVIKAAINKVSSVRGQLGAYQNRLEHTQNNLSVMTENIQDAESTIRDTDVADEMMAYVKNNILVQSAQAMLAQANQVPQGVLQLLG